MSGSELHPSVAFASRYGSPTDEYFNAHSALVRAGELIEDAKQILNVFDKVYPEDSRWAPWWGADIISYYAVGLVTCLEWHARSRTTDIFTYKPTSIDANDVKGRLSEKILPQMLSQNATVAQLLGGGMSVNKLLDYIGAFNRVFKVIGIIGDVHEWLKKPIDGELTFEGHHFEAIDEMYRFRHMMVHEIGTHVLGHRNIREDWSPEVAIENSTLIYGLIKKLERVIYDHAKKDFPNLIDHEGNPLQSTDYLAAEVKSLEERLTRIMDNFLASNSLADEDNHHLDEIFKLSGASIEAEMQFIGSASILHSPYINLREPARLLLLRNRISYLKGIIDMASSHWVLEDTEETKSE